MQRQGSCSHAEYAGKKRQTRRDRFLAEMEAVVPWVRRVDRLRPFYPKGERGRPPVGVERMLRIYFLQQWYGLADEALDGEAHIRPRVKDPRHGEKSSAISPSQPHQACFPTTPTERTCRRMTREPVWFATSSLQVYCERLSLSTVCQFRRRTDNASSAESI